MGMMQKIRDWLSPPKPKSDLADRLAKAKTANEMAAIVGLKPINAKGQRMFYPATPKDDHDQNGSNDPPR